MKKIINKIFILIFVTTNFIFSQNDNSQQIESEFSLALSLFNSGQFNEAEKIFSWITEQPSIYKETTTSYLFISKCKIKTFNYTAAEEILKKFRIEFPTSKYISESYIIESEIFILTGNYRNAGSSLLDAFEAAINDADKNFIRNRINDLSEEYLQSDFWEQLNNEKSSIELRPLILIQLGKAYHKENQQDKAKNTFYEIIKNYPHSVEHEQAINYYQGKFYGSKKNEEEILIAALIPIKSITDNGEYIAAKEILEGIKFAVDEHNKQSNLKIALIIRDTERSSEKIKEIVIELREYENLKAIIGPVYSDETKILYDEIKGKIDVPVIVPTANDNSLEKLNDNFFFANPNFRIRGSAMANFIYYVETKKKIAVISMNESYALSLSEYFVSSFYQCGGEIVFNQSINFSTEEIDAVINNLKKFSGRFDGIYIPITDKNAASYIISKLYSSNINVDIYGNQDWFNAPGLETASIISNRLKFTSDYFIDYNDSEFLEFSENFNLVTSFEVNKNSLYGYGAASFLIGSIVKSENENTDLKDILESDQIFESFHNNIQFGKKHINNFLNIIRFKDGKFELIDKYKL